MVECLLYFPSSLLKKRAVTLVVHGLNVKPLAMRFFIHWLNSQGSDVLLVKLAGHDADSISIREVTKLHWENNMIEGYESANKAALQHNVPLFFLAYSLGALLGQTLLLLEGRSFHKQILISPAIAIRRRSYIIKGLFFLGNSFALPSFTPKAYSFNSWIPISIYKILFGEEAKFLQHVNADQLRIPTLFLMDPKDEMISVKKLQRIIKIRSCSSDQLVLLNSSLKERSQKYHHLIIDEQTMGKNNWADVSQKLETFLFH